MRPSGWSRAATAAVAAFALGGGVLFLAGAEWLRVIAATVLVAGIVTGAFAIATPAALAGDPPAEETERTRRGEDR